MPKARLSRVDRDAMRRAIELLRKRGGVDAQQIEDKLAREPWEEVGRFASYACQDTVLQLKPWEFPPCWADTNTRVKAWLAMPSPDTHGQVRAAELVQQLLKLGLSRYEPAPLAAIAKAEAEAKARARAQAEAQREAEKRSVMPTLTE